MQGAALIVHIQRAVMVVGIGGCVSRLDMRVPMGSNRHRLIHIKRMVVDQWNNTRYLGDREERQ